jgi:hypothetical protein
VKGRVFTVQVPFAIKELGLSWLRPPRRFFVTVRGKMLRPRAFDFYALAAGIHPAADVAGGASFKGNLKLIRMLSDAASSFMIFRYDEFCEKYLPASTSRAADLEKFLRTEFFTGDPTELKDLPETLKHTDAQVIQEGIHAFETSLEDELGKLPIFCCEEDRVGNFSVDKLLKGASNGYPEAIRKHLTDKCTREIDEAGRCLVYERSTAAGFHVLRSIELTARQYLFSVPDFVMPLNRQNWGEYLLLLKTNGAGREVTDHLHNIKDNYRNPLMHPEDVLEIDEAVSLFGVAQSMNETLIADMKKEDLLNDKSGIRQIRYHHAQGSFRFAR